MQVAVVDGFISNITASFIRQNSMGAFLDKPKTDKNNDQGVAHVSLIIIFSLKFKDFFGSFCISEDRDVI